MLELAGSQTSGTITWATGIRTLRDHVVPRISDAASRGGKPEPRIVAGFPVAVTPEAEQARKTADQLFQGYARLPSYRAMLEREGVEGLGDLAIVGDADGVAEQLLRLREVGVTDFWAVPFPAGIDGAAIIDRTWNLLRQVARRDTR
jgi:alkanesulfonate monooxygenase SsuD/methylene tetrahydromethanopterin reductase-like flavin-dependent oxidoreductase (luciferase family)